MRLTSSPMRTISILYRRRKASKVSENKYVIYFLFPLPFDRCFTDIEHTVHVYILHVCIYKYIRKPDILFVALIRNYDCSLLTFEIRRAHNYTIRDERGMIITLTICKRVSFIIL